MLSYMGYVGMCRSSVVVVLENLRHGLAFHETAVDMVYFSGKKIIYK